MRTTDNGGVTIMAQQYLPAIKDGDKRVLMINGEAVPFCLARLPMAGENRGNLAAEALVSCNRCQSRSLDYRKVGPGARRMLFVADIIGDISPRSCHQPSLHARNRPSEEHKNC